MEEDEEAQEEKHHGKLFSDWLKEEKVSDVKEKRQVEENDEEIEKPLDGCTLKSKMGYPVDKEGCQSKTMEKITWCQGTMGSMTNKDCNCKAKEVTTKRKVHFKCAGKTNIEDYQIISKCECHGCSKNNAYKFVVSK